MSVKWLGDTRANYKDLGELVARYVFNGNKSVSVSSVDTVNNIFTSTAHGLTNGQRVAIFLNQNAGKIHPFTAFPTGFSTNNSYYYVVNATTDTFQVSATSGGAAKTISGGDITKWHFEVIGATLISISNLPPAPKYRCILYGTTASNVSLMLYPSAPNNWNDNSSIRYADNTFGNCSLGSSANYWNYVEAYFDSTGIAKASYKGKTITASPSAATFTGTSITDAFVFTNTTFADSLISGITFNCGELIANGTVMEVYTA
ncbi:hypothetical protein [Paenibacillus cremeus]|uniref:Uncharacterized protein n=1 Tax=Paenibacillus cremeus TaxID=2163881 RepID=A0A559KCW7_9BACL|nr:hypothetical protein [Paenibacillus cremeus]TVY09977.1 hypothetical protein FPZ49_11440 [Paenibacillus cremeus]